VINLIEKVTENILVIGEDGASNTTVISGKNCVIVIDTSLFPEKALRIRKFAQEIFGKPVGLVINTHYHPDHTFGNSAFEDVDILASEMTKKLMEEMSVDYIESVWGKDRMTKYHVVIPNQVFTTKKSTNECGIRMTVMNLGGHTPDSSVIFLENDGVIIAGDLVLNDYHLEIAEDSDMDSWKKALDVMREMSPLFVIPGHGRLGGAELIGKSKDYLMKIEQFVSGKISKEELLSDTNFSTRGFPELFSSSIKILFKTLAES
jgi:cyclase